MKSPLAPSTGSRRAAGRRARPGRLAALGLAVLATGTIAGCQANNTPKSYTDQNDIVKTNFMATCTGNIPNASTTTVLASTDQCTCLFDVFYNNVPYNADDRGRIAGYPSDKPTFEELENQTGNDPSKINDLPANVQSLITGCKSKGTVGPVAPGATTAGSTAPGTTAPAGTTTTTTTTAAP